jgi:hypothetical protein
MVSFRASIQPVDPAEKFSTLLAGNQLRKTFVFHVGTRRTKRFERCVAARLTMPKDEVGYVLAER